VTHRKSLLIWYNTHNDRHPSRVQDCEDDIRSPADVVNGWGCDVHDDEVADPVCSGRNGRALLTCFERQDLGRIYPNSGLEADGEGSLEDEQHSGGADACCVC
jgi:hypothetical protein